MTQREKCRGGGAALSFTEAELLPSSGVGMCRDSLKCTLGFKKICTVFQAAILAAIQMQHQIWTKTRELANGEILFENEFGSNPARQHRVFLYSILSVYDFVDLLHPIVFS